MRSANRPRMVVVLATVLVLAYGLGLMIHVQKTPHIGIQTTFTLKVGRVDSQFVELTSNDNLSRLKGCHVRQVGPYFVDNWPRLLRSLRELQNRAPADGSEPTFVRRGDESWVRVVLQQSTTSDPFEVWCRLGHTPIESALPALLWLILEVGLFAIGAFVYWKRPGDPYAGPFFSITLFAVGAYLGGYYWWQITTQPALMVFFVISSVMLPAATLHYFHVVPQPKPWFRSYRRLSLLLIYLPPAVTGFLMLTGYFWVRYLFRAGGTPAEINGALDGVRLALYLAIAVAAFGFGAGILALFHGFLRAVDASERSQSRWILLGSLAALAPIGYSLYLIIFDPVEFVGGGAAWPMFAASACITVAFTVSITRHRLLRLDLLIGSGVFYFLLSFFAVLVYYVLVFTGMLLVGSQVIAGPSLGQAFWVSSTALILLGVLDLVRSRINRSLEHYYRRDKKQLDRTLHQLSDAIDHLVEPPTLARHLLDASAELLAVSRGALFLGEGDPPLFRMAGRLGELPALTELAPGCPLVDQFERQSIVTLVDSGDNAVGEQLQLLGGEVALALRHEQRLLGFLILGSKATGFYQAEDFNLLSALAPIAALALQSAAGRRSIEALNREVQLKVEKISEQQERILSLQRQLVRQTAAAPDTTIPMDSSIAELDSGMVGSSAVVGRLLDLVRKVAASQSAVLIRGESGTGKELVARAIHDNSARSAQPFVKVHCAALSPSLLESELFGHVKGAFTGATSNKIGRFELANGGTLFLDEIGDISLDVQIKLLRVLQEKTFERVGSSEPVRVDVRVVAATHQNLERLIEQNRFREDLYYRLNVIAIAVPPLRDRREDIPELIGYFLRQMAVQTGRPAPEVDDEALAAFRDYAWPGNIRQLRNVVERAMVVSDGSLIRVDDLPPELHGQNDSLTGDNSTRELEFVRLAPKSERMRKERDALVRALAEARGNKAEAARALGIPRSTLLSRMQRHGLS